MTEAQRANGRHHGATPVRIGVLALQGDFREHAETLRRLGADAIEVRKAAQLDGLQGLIVPGGESTTIIKLLREFALIDPVRAFQRQGKAVWGTCAGMIVVAHEATDLNEAAPLGFIDVSVRRNAFGRQVDSFEEQLPIPALGDEPFPCVFIRAPSITHVGKDVVVLAKLPDGTPVAARQDRVLVTAFHPELTRDTRLHAYFLDLARGEDTHQR